MNSMQTAIDMIKQEMSDFGKNGLLIILHKN